MCIQSGNRVYKEYKKRCTKKIRYICEGIRDVRFNEREIGMVYKVIRWVIEKSQ